MKIMRWPITQMELTEPYRSLKFIQCLNSGALFGGRSLMLPTIGRPFGPGGGGGSLLRVEVRVCAAAKATARTMPHKGDLKVCHVSCIVGYLRACQTTQRSAILISKQGMASFAC